MLKNILSLLLSKFYSKQENEAVAQQAMPSRSIVALVPTKTSIDSWGVVFEGTAPTNGYASISFTASSDFCIASAQSYEAQTFSSPKVAGDVLLVMCPVAKGRKFILCARNAKNITCEFIETIGGGYQVFKKLILQGGGLCLNSLSSSLRRSSCRVKDRGFNTQLVRPRMQRPSALQPTANGINLHPAGTAISRTLETPQALFWKSLMVAQVSLILNRLQDGILFRYRKVKNLGISFQQIQQCPICTLSLCGVQTNSAVGGASC